MTTGITVVLDADVIEVADPVGDLAPQPRSNPEPPSADPRANTNANPNADTDTDTDQETTTTIPRAELLTGELWPEREVSRAIVTTGIVCGVAGFALGYWFGNRERWSL